MQNLLDGFVLGRRERGVQLAVYHEGRLVVDAWAGMADPATGTMVSRETLFPVFSVSKGMAATVIHRLVERGLLSYDMRISEVWPEFGVNGKENITLRQGLNHTAGIPQMPREAELETTNDWHRMCELISRLEPIFTPGTQAQYHAITYGWIVGEPACRVTGLTFPELLAQEISVPLGVEKSMYIGLPRHSTADIAVLEHQIAPPKVDPNPGPESVPARYGPLHEMMNRRDLQEACLPATSGVMSAGAIARHYAALLPGGVDGVQLLTETRLREAITRPKVGPETISHGLGYGFAGSPPEPGEVAKAFGHRGYGGSNGFANYTSNYAVGFARNRFDDEETPNLVFDEIQKALQ